jgi:hypothetical protein
VKQGQIAHSGQPEEEKVRNLKEGRLSILKMDKKD